MQPHVNVRIAVLDEVSVYPESSLHASGLKSTAELGKDKPHGTRMRYMAGCKCDECRSANTSYEKERARARKEGDFNGIVSAEAARKHMLKLSKKGVGYKSVAEITDIASSVIFKIYSGHRKQCRARTARKILAVTVDMAADGAYTSAKRSWKLINKLIDQGYTKVEIAEGIGQKRALQLGKNQITVKHAAAIEKLFNQLDGKKVPKNATEIVTPTKTGYLVKAKNHGHLVHHLV